MEKIEPSARWENYGQEYRKKKKKNRRLLNIRNFPSSPQPFQIH